MYPEFDMNDPIKSLARQISLSQIALTAVLTKASPEIFAEFASVMKEGAAMLAQQEPQMAQGAEEWLSNVMQKRQNAATSR